MPTVAQHFVQRGFPVSQPASEDGLRPAAPVVLMVSGGADSTALLVMACTSKLDIGDGRGAARIARERLHVLHVNHHLRGVASDDDERFVRDLCDRYGRRYVSSTHRFLISAAGTSRRPPARCAMPLPAVMCGGSAGRREPRAPRPAS